MNNTYECSICLSLNHSTRFQCKVCGTIPTQYSWRRVPINYRLVPVVVAAGVYRASQHNTQRVNLRTVSHDYYAEV